MKETPATSSNGIVVVLLLLAAVGMAIWLLVLAALAQIVWAIVASAVTIAALLFSMLGAFKVEPNQGRVLTLFGDYRGTERRAGLRWANPFLGKRSVSLRVRNFETSRLKVNDADGNPIEIAAVVVWKVVDTFEAVFRVDDFENFVHVQSESALRGLATRYPYDSHGDEQSLRGSTPEIAQQLQREIDERLAQAGVEVLEARISHLAYAQEIAHAMLQRQQASAIIAARQKIVELDEERKAAMVSNLLVVLCGDRSTTPVISTGTLHTG